MRSIATLLFFISLNMYAYTPGDLDTAFNAGGNQPGVELTNISSGGSAINALAIQPNSKIVVTGYSFNATDGFNLFTTARYNSTGGLDGSFGGSGFVTTDFALWPGGEVPSPQGPTEGTAQGVAIQPNGAIVVVGGDITGEFDTSKTQGFVLVRYNANGSLDTSFGGEGLGYEILQFQGGAPARGYFLYSALLLSNGQILCGGEAAGPNDFSLGAEWGSTSLMNSNGAFDTSFGEPQPGEFATPGTTLTAVLGEAQIFSQALRSNGQIYAGGYSNPEGFYNNKPLFMVARWNADGTYDLSWEFAPAPAIATASIGLYGIGSVLDTSPTQANSIAYYAATDQLYLAGFSSTPSVFTIGRLNNDATPDASFGFEPLSNPGFVFTSIGSASAITSILIDPSDNRVIAGGWATIDGVNNFALAKYDFDGSLYPGFGMGGLVITPITGASNAQINALVLDTSMPNATTLVAGGVATIGGVNQFVLARYLLTDTPTADSGSVTVDASVTTIITLTGNEPFSQLLTFSITTDPGHGILGSITQPLTGALVQMATVPYTPTLTYTGSDSFSFLVNNGVSLSNTATISLSVIDTVSAFSDSGFILNVNTPSPLPFSGYDAAAVPLTFTIVSNPAHGTLGPISQPPGGTLIQTATVTYMPNLNFLGPDSFTFDVTNGYLISNTAIISFTVEDIPTATSASCGVADHIANPIVLTATDPLSALLTFSIITPPAHGALSALTQPTVGVPTQHATLTYMPFGTFAGSDSFTFQASNSLMFSQPSNIATVDLNVVNAGTDPFTIRLIQKYGHPCFQE